VGLLKQKKMDNYEELEALLNQLKVDLEKFYNKGNQAASVRARKTLQEIKEQAQTIRMDISKTRKILKGS
jgi:septation ring formation regulator EzrA